MAEQGPTLKQLMKRIERMERRQKKQEEKIKILEGKMEGKDPRIEEYSESESDTNEINNNTNDIQNKNENEMKSMIVSMEIEHPTRNITKASTRKEYKIVIRKGIKWIREDIRHWIQKQHIYSRRIKQKGIHKEQRSVAPLNVTIDLDILRKVPEDIEKSKPKIIEVWKLSNSHRKRGTGVVKSGLGVVHYFVVLTNILAPILSWPEDSKTFVSLAKKQLAEEAHKKAIKEAIRDANENKNKRKPKDAPAKETEISISLEIDDLIICYNNLASLMHTYDEEKSTDNDDALGFLIITFSLKLTSQKTRILILHELLEELVRAVKSEQIRRYREEHPYFVYCGELHNLECCHVIVSGRTYDSKFAVEAVDFLFKLFLVIKLPWPLACPQVWSSLMKWKYEIVKTRKIASGASVNDLINDLKTCWNACFTRGCVYIDCVGHLFIVAATNSSKMDINDLATDLSRDFYSNLNLSRSDIQYVMEKLSHFISDAYNPFLLEELNENFRGAVRKEVSEELERTFKKYQTPFEHLNTESQRLQVYAKLSCYKEPQMCTVAQTILSKLSNTHLDIKTKDISIVRFPINEGLKRLPEIEGLFDATLKYYYHLMANEYPLENFCQG
ncbi:hypothetical protein QAD02_007612 [Eretmocerus hayati]|uniref:Uncharacterized protein n=1 Tax=Eretmocerus hayati TaxID=131215 RepID=A0ACC2N446_9HYME|nr:hypothetical protein QAD02_007612 [Eretmocerus hayati]